MSSFAQGDHATIKINGNVFEVIVQSTAFKNEHGEDVRLVKSGPCDCTGSGLGCSHRLVCKETSLTPSTTEPE